MCYSSTNPRLAALGSALTDVYPDLPNLSCSRQRETDACLLGLKFWVLYFMSIIVCTIYAWHYTVRCSHCIFVFSIIGTVIFHTDLVLYWDKIGSATPIACYGFITTSFMFEDLMPHKSSDPLLALCEKFTSPLDSNAILHSDSKGARFYRLVKNMKQKWAVQEEKLIFTLIGGILINGVMTWLILAFQ